MAGLSSLAASAIGTPNQFNWPWFIELCVCGILAIFFLFYFNRLFATLLSYSVRAYAWHNYRVWVDIQALQISLLGGRLFFKGVRYHGENETILVHNGYITWRYWFRNVRQADLTINDLSRGGKKNERSSSNDSATSPRTSVNLDEELGAAPKPALSEARVAVFVNGLEWFIYNRTPLYDAILRDDPDTEAEIENTQATSTGVSSSEALRVHLRSKLRRRPKSSEASLSEISELRASSSEKPKHEESNGPELVDKQSVTTNDPESAESDVTAIQSLLVQLLPLYIECSRAAISIGNEHTRALLVTTIDKAKGHVDARGCGPDDLFRQIFEFDIDHPVVQMRPNPDFIGTQLSVAEHVIGQSDFAITKRRWWNWNLHLQRRKHKAVHALRNLVPGLHSSVESLHHSRRHSNERASQMPFVDIDWNDGDWHGLSRYLNEDDSDDHQSWANVEYARFSTILDCPSVHMIFYWDTPGRVKAEHMELAQATNSSAINGIEPPAYGLDLTIRGGNINYGPWADRLRAEIQSVFFPSSYRSPKPAKPLVVGQWRQSSNMIIRIDIEEEITLRVPTRENSKDWRWRGKVTAVRDAVAIRKNRQRRHFLLRRGQKGLMGPDLRPFGWIAVSVSSDSSVRYEMDMTAGPMGYRNQLRLDLKNTKATSSVNHADLWRCAGQKLQCNLSNPLIWNSHHTWHFDIQNQSMELFLLRDHMFLLTDLIADFTAGQKSNYMTFVPFEYKIALRFDNLKLFLNANDYNIIDNPCDLDGNAFIILGARELEGIVDIPIKYFSASQNSVHFRAHANDGYLDLKTPAWNTLHAFAKDENMAVLKALDLGGSYNYNSGTSAGLTDSLFMDIVGDTPRIHLQGFLIRYFMNVKENYFGEDLHFRTLEEYQERLASTTNGHVEDQRRPIKKDNDLDVVLNIRAQNSCALMPANIYVREENLRIDIMLIEADMRFTNYYMDLQVNSSPIEVSTEKDTIQNGKPKKDTTACQLYISAVTVYGHRLFGAPPTEPTYVCNWDFDIGSIYGECSTQMLRVLIAAIQSFVFTLDDDENALPIAHGVTLNDITFLRATVGGIQVWLSTNKASFLVETGCAMVSFNDWAGQHFSKNLKASLPQITLAVVELPDSLRWQNKIKQKVHTLACIQTSIDIVNIDKKADFEYQQQLQQDHVQFHDLRTHRVPFLLHNRKPLELPTKDIQWSQDPPAMPVPDLPIPVRQRDYYNSHGSDIIPARSHMRQKSFLSSQSSVSSRGGPGSITNKLLKQQQFDQSSMLQHSSADDPKSKYNLPRGSFMGGSGEGAHQSGNDGSFSSPWIEPNFPLRRIRPDLSQMPFGLTQFDTNIAFPINNAGAEQEYTDSNESIPHAAIFCNVANGIRGFCLPQVFPAVVDVIQSIGPQDPHSILDSIQQSTFAIVKRLHIVHLGEKIDFALRIPLAAIRLLDTEQTVPQSSDLLTDQYELTVSKIHLKGRVAPTVTKQTHSETTANILLIEASIRDLDISITENLKSGRQEVAKLQVSLQDTEFWLSMQDKIRSKLQLGSFQISTGGSTVDRLAVLAERSRIMITQIVENFATLDQTYAAKHLAYHLSLLNTNTADPPFLSKPSYVLRSASEHIRLTDSWKILARFRQRISTQTLEERRDLMEHNSCMFEQQEEKARQQILEAIDSWMTWYRGHEACEPILTAIFGKSNTKSNVQPKIDDVEISIYLGQIAVVLDPGPDQSELVLRSGDINISQKPDFSRSASYSHDVVHKSRVNAQVWFADTLLDLNWNLIELARSLVKQVNISSAVAESTTRRRSSSLKPAADELDVTVVLGTDIAAIRIRTINLDASLGAQNLKTSTIVQSQGTNSTISVLMASDGAHLKLGSSNAPLFNWKLRNPSVYGLQQQNRGSLKDANTTRFAASCDRLRFDMREDVLTILEVIDTVIRDEIVIIQDVVDSIEQQTAVVRNKSEPISSAFADIHVAFFLNNYKLQVRLLPALHYHVTGTVARTSIFSQPISKYIVHVDIKKNTHALINPAISHTSSAATFDIPPINGKFVIDVHEDLVIVKARSTLELVRIEAKAIQACVEAVYKAERLNRLKQCKALLDRIQGSMKDESKQIPRSQTPIPSASGAKKTILYSGHAVFEGFDLQCSAPTSRNQNYEAVLNFGLHEATLRIRNHRKASVTPIDKPQFEVYVRQIFAGLNRRTKHVLRNYGQFGMGLRLKGITQVGSDGEKTQNYQLRSESVQLDLYSETVALAIDMITFLQGSLTQLTTPDDRIKIKPLRRLTLANNDSKAIQAQSQTNQPNSATTSNLFDMTFVLELNLIRLRWIVVDDAQAAFGRVPEDLVFSIKQIDLRTQRESSARLKILDLQLQTVPKRQDDPVERTANSALLPEMIFSAAHFSTKKDRRFAFQAAGKALDLHLAADGIIPLSTIQKSLARATADLRNAKTIQEEEAQPDATPITSFLGNKRLASLLVDADFAGAVVKITPCAEKDVDFRNTAFSLLKGPKRSKAGRYGQAVQSGGAEEAVLRAPGIAVKVEYLDAGNRDPTLSTEVKVAASSNTLAPSVVPLVLEIYSSIKEIIGEDSTKASKPDIRTPAQRYLSDAASVETDPTAILGRVRLNAGLLVQRQEFSLTCQPLARVAATAKFDEIFIAVNTVQDGEHERFFSIITNFNKLQASVQHVYSRESTASFEVQTIIMSLMNSKHVNAKNGVSAILNVSPMRASLNVKQMQDFLLFREIWYPAELRQRSKPPSPTPPPSDSQAYAMQKYHELAATAALPWHAVVSIHELKLDVDFGQTLGKSSFIMSKLWASSKKSSDWEQNLCIGFDRIGIDSAGRLSGFIELNQLRVRTSIRWPLSKDSDIRAPLVQASIGFGHLRLKTAFDYQPFAVADVSSFDFLMYNVRPTQSGDNDRLVGILNGGKVQVFCISTVAAQALSIVQAFERLFQEKRDAFQESLRELDKLLRRKSVFPFTAPTMERSTELELKVNDSKRESHRLHTDVVVSLKAIDIGAFPNTFFDNQILKIEAVDAQARFAVSTLDEQVHSGLGMTLGQVRVALSTVNKPNTKALGEVEINEVIERATNSRGGTILKVPRLVASMQTWQEAHSYMVEYIFRSTFQGKVDVGWNYSRIRFIRNMWETHSQALAHRLGKPLPPAAVKITTEPHEDGSQEPGQEKITAVVNVPQSTKFQYVALEPPIIDTPQLRDMGEATPPLEWIGLHRDKLPNVTHSIIIVTLLEVAKEVEEAYTRILGTG